MSVVCYVCPSAPSLSLRVTVDGKDQRIQFTNKELQLDAEKYSGLIAVLDELIETKPNITMLIHKVDIEAARQLALAHMDSLKRHRGTVTGPVSADDAKRSAEMAIQERDADLAAQGATVQDLENMHKEMDKDHHLQLTENAKGVVAPENREGFIADPSPEPEPVIEGAVQETALVPDPKAVFANLGK